MTHLLSYFSPEEPTRTSLKIRSVNHNYTVESGYLVYVPDGSTTATCGTSGLALSMLLTSPSIMMSLDFQLKLIESVKSSVRQEGMR